MQRFDDLDPDPALTPDQELVAETLTADQLDEIDAALLRACRPTSRKLAMVVATAMYDVPFRIDGLPDVFYARRVAALVARGRLEAVGDLTHMPYCEVRLATTGSVGGT